MVRQWKHVYRMNFQLRIRIGIIVVPILGMMVPLANGADLGPEIFQGNGSECVAESDFMRINHMNVLIHQGNKTLREGIRGGDFSLKECISCHAVPGDDGKPVSFDNDRHFCRSCHDYAAVNIDCFTCHNSVPDSEKVVKKDPTTQLLLIFSGLIHDE